MVKQCPFLEKFYIPSEPLEDWNKWVCSDCCPLQDLCIFDIEGKVPPILLEKLKNGVIPCPKCQKDAVYAKEVKIGVRLSGLRPDEEGWKCLYCSFIIYRLPVIKIVRRKSSNRRR